MWSPVLIYRRLLDKELLLVSKDSALKMSCLLDRLNVSPDTSNLLITVLDRSSESYQSSAAYRKSDWFSYF
jgi:hypothetical protein